MAPTGTFMRFCVVGAIGFVVDVTVLYGLSNLLGWHAARLASFLCAATTTWMLNRRLTFSGRRSHARMHEYLRYLVSMLGGGLVNYLVYLVTLHGLAGRYAPASGVAIGSLAGLLVNYLLARYVVFGSQHKP